MGVFIGKSRRSWSGTRRDDGARNQICDGHLCYVRRWDVFVRQFYQGGVHYIETVSAGFKQFRCVLVKDVGLRQICGWSNREDDFISNGCFG